MKSTRSRPVFAAALVSFAVFAAPETACHRSPAGAAPTSPGAAEGVDAAIEGPSDAEAAVLPARCRRAGPSIRLGDAGAFDDLELGDAVSYPSGYAVSLVHRTSVGRVAALALLGRPPAALVRLVDLGPTLGDAPPPRIAWRPPDLVAAMYVLRPETKPASVSGRGELTREVGLYAVAGGAVPAPIVVTQRRDDSLALDLAFAGQSGLLVWDEATSAPRGIIRAAAVAKDQVAAAQDISPQESDAELPRVVAWGAGFLVVWIARRPELASDAAESEVPGELRAFGWLELMSVDLRGTPTGSVRRLTSPSGHVSAFDLAVRSTGDARTLLVVAHDEGEAVDGSGGALLRVRVGGPDEETIEAPVAFATDGLGRGVPSFVSTADSDSLALQWVGKDDDPRFLPLDGAGSPIARPSAENELKDARPLLFLDEPAAGAQPMLVAAPFDAAEPLRIVQCAK